MENMFGLLFIFDSIVWFAFYFWLNCLVCLWNGFGKHYHTSCHWHFERKSQNGLVIINQFNGGKQQQ